MRDDRKEMLTEQYEEAWFDLMLDQYAEEEGNRLLEEYRQAAPATVSLELDRKCREAAQKVFKYHDRKLSLRSTARRAGRAAVIGLVTLGLFATMVMSVDALRIPTLEFITKQYEKFTTITKPDNTRPPIPENMLNDGSPLAGIIPDTFNTLNYQALTDVILAGYQGSNGEMINFSRSSLNGVTNFDTEGAQRKKIEIIGFAGEIVVKGNQVTVYWIDEAKNYIYFVASSNMAEDETWRIAVETAKKYSGKSTAEPITYLDDGSPLAGVIPNTFELINKREAPSGTVVASYTGPNNEIINFSRSPLNGVLNIDTEDAQCTPITILDFNGELIVKQNKISIYWIDEISNKVLHISTLNMTEEETRTIALATARKYSDQSAAAPTGHQDDASTLA